VSEVKTTYSRPRYAGISRHHLVPYIGQRGHVYDILNRRRRLSLTMIQRLHEGLGIPGGLLVRPVQLARDAAE